jgi:Protein of unknown function (DUF2384)
MNDVQANETKQPPKALEGESEKLESLLLRLQKHLQWASEDPDRDLQEIKKFVIEASAQLERPQRSVSPMEVVSGNLFKDEPMTEPAISATAESREERARSSELLKLLTGLVDHPKAWLTTPSAHFGGRRPGDLVGTDEEYKIVDLLQAVDQGLF